MVLTFFFFLIYLEVHIRVLPKGMGSTKRSVEKELSHRKVLQYCEELEGFYIQCSPSAKRNEVQL